MNYESLFRFVGLEPFHFIVFLVEADNSHLVLKVFTEGLVEVAV